MFNCIKHIGLTLFSVFFMTLGVCSLLVADEDAYIELAHKWAREGDAYAHYNGYVEEINKAFIDRIDRELHIYGFATEKGRTEKIEHFHFQFYPRYRATIEEARALQLYLRDRLAQAVNANENIQPYLIERPFPPERINVVLNFEGDNPRRIYSDGSVSRVHAEFSGVAYFAMDPFINDSILLLGETNDEARKRNEAFTGKVGEHRVTDMEEANNQLIKQLTQILELKYGLTVNALGGRLAYGVEEIGARLTSNLPLTQGESRALLVRVVDDLLNAINHNQTSKPYLKEEPFPASRVRLQIDFIDSRYFTRSSFTDGSMQHIAFDGREIIYKPFFEAKGRESFEEAHTIVKNTPPPTFGEYCSRFFRDVVYWIGSLLINVYYFIVLLIFYLLFSWNI